MPYITNAPDWEVIRSYFTQTDVEHMLEVTSGRLDLSSCNSVLENAECIYDMVSNRKMPPANPWSAEKVNNFFSWWKSNPSCPSQIPPVKPEAGRSY